MASSLQQIQKKIQAKIKEEETPKVASEEALQKALEGLIKAPITDAFEYKKFEKKLGILEDAGETGLSEAAYGVFKEAIEAVRVYKKDEFDKEFKMGTGLMGMIAAKIGQADPMESLIQKIPVINHMVNASRAISSGISSVSNALSGTGKESQEFEEGLTAEPKAKKPPVGRPDSFQPPEFMGPPLPPQAGAPDSLAPGSGADESAIEMKEMWGDYFQQQSEFGDKVLKFLEKIEKNTKAAAENGDSLFDKIVGPVLGTMMGGVIGKILGKFLGPVLKLLGMGSIVETLTGAGGGGGMGPGGMGPPDPRGRSTPPGPTGARGGPRGQTPNARPRGRLGRMGAGIGRAGKAIAGSGVGKAAGGLLKGGGKALQAGGSMALKGGSKLLKAVPLLGTLAAVGMSGYDLYDEYKTTGKVSGKGVGSAAGSLIGGAAGMLLGPLGAMAGAYAGDWLGGKIGGMFDEDDAGDAVKEATGGVPVTIQKLDVQPGEMSKAPTQNGSIGPAPVNPKMTVADSARQEAAAAKAQSQAATNTVNQNVVNQAQKGSTPQSPATSVPNPHAKSDVMQDAFGRDMQVSW